jgi:hypothetical protein
MHSAQQLHMHSSVATIPILKVSLPSFKSILFKVDGNSNASNLNLS